VSAERVRAGIQAGLIAAAATGGALLAFGMGLNRPWLPFNLAAHVLLGGRAAVVAGPHAMVTPIGVLVHIGAILIWGILFVAIVGRRRWAVMLPAAVLFALTVFLLNTRIFPISLRPGYESVLSDAQMMFLHFALGVTLVVGTRLAFSPRE
jgi:hypothetical protein